ncbi:echinoderm microtubule-associated protein-like 2 isoform X6 [Tachypleus tridentatus]|uniref:echinoderm microtubule-associated protein-like 2 isoform X6 n=1 Tax=Tachypleus tridentatus TaxID=6853 RepID=UPI003FCFD924
MAVFNCGLVIGEKTSRPLQGLCKTFCTIITEMTVILVTIPQHVQNHVSIRSQRYSLLDEIFSNGTDPLESRISELEKKVGDQADEIVSLKSTIADILRRVSQMEGRAVVITNNSITTPNKITSSSRPSYRTSGSNMQRDVVDGNGTENSYHIQVNNKQRSPSATDIKNQGARLSDAKSDHRSPMYAEERSHTRTSYGPKRLSHYPAGSTSSLQSEGGQSSNSLSPSSSPAPSQNSIRGTPSPRHTPSPSRGFSASTSNLLAMKRFSGSQEAGSPAGTLSRRVTTGSLLNLHVRTASVLQPRHGTKEISLNSEEGTLKMYLRGRPIVMHIPSEFLQDYTLSKVNNAPLQRLRLEWVYGYRGRDCRSNLHLLPTGEMVYFVAAVVVLYNVDDQTQRHYLGHTDDVKCLAVHPNKLIIASGQVAGVDRRERRPHIRVWDSVSLNTLHVIGIGEFERSVCCVAFSKADGGSLLCAVDDSPEHAISVWEWHKGEKGHKITETKSSSDTVLAAEFHPMDRYALVTLGKGHIHFWGLECGTLVKKLGLFEKQDKPKYVLCMAFTDVGDLLTGDSNGNIIVWSRGSNRQTRTLYGAHEGPVFSLCVMKDGTFVSGGGKDRRIIEWDDSCTRTGREAKLPDASGGIRTLTQGKGSMLLVGTTKNCVLQGTLMLNFSTVVQGHTEELWGLAIHPTQNQFLSGGYDGNVHLWDSMSHSVVWSIDIREPVQSACFSPDGNIIVLATVTGRWMVMDSATRQLYNTNSDINQIIDCIKFSPDGKLLAVGSHDNYLYIYQVQEDYKKYNRIGRCSGHSSYLTHFDWSENSTYIQTTSGDHELLFWNASICRQVTDMAVVRDITWETQTCTLGFNVLGVWPETADGSDINTCDRSHNKKLLVTGDDFGKVKLFLFPACQPKSLHHMYSGHSSHVTAVSFLPDDTRVVSLGGRDCSIMQWSVC